MCYSKGQVFKVLCMLVLVCLTHNVFSQSGLIPPLERKVSIDVSDQRIQVVLAGIEKQSGCVFSYNANLVNDARQVTLRMTNRPVREILVKLFGNELIYKTKDNYIILLKAPKEKKVISGYVENTKGEKVAGASIYDPNTLASATTDEFGYFEMKIKRKSPMQLSVSKFDYSDTIVPLQAASPTLQNIVIEERKDSSFKRVVQGLKTAKDTVFSKLSMAGNWTVEQFTRNQNVRNISDTIPVAFQIGFVPFFGTNGRLSGNVINDWSVNILGGYSRGVRKGEFAGLFNIDREDVSYFQMAGLFNVVGGSMKGFQIAGLSNLNLKGINGYQIGGLSNINMRHSDGAQLGGLWNVNMEGYRGLQIGGLLNYNQTTSSGLSIGGLANVGVGDYKGLQIGGLGNVQFGNLKGVQIGGVVNLSSGITKGVQIGGVLNIANNMKGVQIGLFNFADSLSGIPIGLISFVNHGYHKIELSYDELGYGNMAFRTGVPLFYNILTAGVKLDANQDTANWTFGYGIGSSPRITDKFFLNIDVVANQIVHGNFSDDLNVLARTYVGIDYQLSKRFSVTAGATFNGYFTDVKARTVPGLEQQKIVYEYRFDDTYRLKFWIGWKVGIRFF